MLVPRAARSRLLAALLAASATSCSALLGLDFEPRDGDLADGGAADAPEADAASGSAPDAGDAQASSAPDAGVPPAFDRAWSRWKVSPPFPLEQTTARDGIVSDDVTALVWAQDPLPDVMAWAEAPAACQALRLGGFTDWRVPTRIELLSLVNPARTPATSADLGLPLAETWSGSRAAGDPSRAWWVAFTQGAVSMRPVTDALKVRCVRRGHVITNAPPLRFTSRSGVIRDAVTGLAWQAAPTKTGTLAEASAHCASVTLDGETGFRVAEIHELLSIVDEQRRNPALDPMFASLGLTWSKTLRAAAVDPLAWTIDEVDGHMVSRGTGELASARCVR